MHPALKDPLYKEAKMDLRIGGKVYVWTAYDDFTDDGASEIDNLESLKKVFKYTYNMGWPIIRVETRI